MESFWGENNNNNDSRMLVYMESLVLEIHFIHVKIYQITFIAYGRNIKSWLFDTYKRERIGVMFYT